MRHTQLWHDIGYKIDYLPSLNETELTNCIESYDALIVGSHKIDRQLIDIWAQSSPSKKAIVRAGSNTSTIDKLAATENNIIVMNTKGLNSRAVVEFIIKKIFSLIHSQKDTQALSDVKSGSIKSRDHYYHDYIEGKVVTLVGTGNIGFRLAKILSMLGATVKAYSPNLTKNKALEMGAIFCTSLHEALTDSDILTIQIPFVHDNTSAGQTYKLIGNEEVALLNRGAFVINISRAGVVDMDMIIQNINSEQLSAFVLDTMPSEIEHILKQYPGFAQNHNIHLTPSIATASNKLKTELTRESLHRIYAYFEENIIIDQVI